MPISEKKYAPNQVAVDTTVASSNDPLTSPSEAPKKVKKKKSKSKIPVDAISESNSSPEGEVVKKKKKKTKTDGGADEKIKGEVAEPPKDPPNIKVLKETSAVEIPTELLIDLGNPRAEKMCLDLFIGDEELAIMQKKFDKVDVDFSGEITIDEFFHLISEKSSDFKRNILRKCLQRTKIKRVTLGEFVLIACSICPINRNELLKFCFTMYDSDGSGALDEFEFIEMCKSFHDGDAFFGGNFAKAMKEFDKNGDGVVDFDEFLTITVAHAMLFYPIFRLQDSLQKHSLGQAKWNLLVKNSLTIQSLVRYMKSHRGALPKLGFVDRFFGKWTGALELRSRAIQKYRKANE